jgi:AAA-like domain/Endonuclease NucS
MLAPSPPISFNIAGPCFPDEHYMLPPERRLGLVLELIRQHKYFTLTAGRQTGKTTSLQWLEKSLPTIGMRALWLDIQTASQQPDPATAFALIFDSCERALGAGRDGLRAPDAAQVAEWLARPGAAVVNYIAHLAAQDPRPLVLLIDEADGLVGQAMVSFLTQLRDGYLARKERPFPSSIALVGQRTVRDYVLTAEDHRALKWLGTASPFNITAEAEKLSHFTEAEVAELLGQHTTATGQRFEPAAIQKIWELGRGHPWLTNALADQIVRRDVKDRSVAITAHHVESAKETIIVERRTHIDSLVARLREPRVRRVIEPMLMGERPDGDLLNDDLAYVVGLGLVTLSKGEIEIANPIYREVIPRALTFHTQVTIHEKPAWYGRPDGSLDMPKLMRAFQAFWREDAHAAVAGTSYRESHPHLMLMAFLQRIVNGGGRIDREYGVGRGALDLLVEWQGRRHVIEVKLRRDARTEAKALEQLTRYLDHLGLQEGWLALFDLRKGTSWSKKLFLRDKKRKGRVLHVLGL